MAGQSAADKTAGAAARARPGCYGPLLALLLAGPAEAHCHVYSIWHYPKPQRCFTALAYAKRASRVPETFHERIDIPMPGLEWTVCPDGDERLRAIAFLRALSNGP